MTLHMKLGLVRAGEAVLINALDTKEIEPHLAEVEKNGWAVYCGHRMLMGHIRWRAYPPAGHEALGQHYAAGSDDDIRERNLELGGKRILIVSNDEIAAFAQVCQKPPAELTELPWRS